MQMSDFVLTAHRRDDQGKGASRRLRRQGMLPAIVYGGHKDPMAITLEQREVLRNLEEEAFYTQIIDLDLEGKKEQVVLKDMQRHPFKPIVLHVDLQRVVAGEALEVVVPLHFVNEETCIGVKQQGGMIVHSMTEVRVRCLPKDIPEYIEIDVQPLELGDVVHLSELRLPAGVELSSDYQEESLEQPVVSVHQMKVAEVEAEAEAEAEGEIPEGEAPEEGGEE
ncbi:MAG: 50S ribosomal protein L25/general stress protein Ctc [Gammaproteobacteria bacterium]|nr:MAG: 50S ribosomal protein L25/general stress protein Ctc [Gammaproteobacteria bacterium]